MTQTADQQMRALVVDDDPIVRQILDAALTAEGFECELAVDGEQASGLMSAAEFDLLVTDLRMPQKNGHALSVDVLGHASRPVIIVHTGVTEPRITKDLIVRGVDDVVYKPTDYAAFAAKAWGMVERHRADKGRMQTRVQNDPLTPSADGAADAEEGQGGELVRSESASVVVSSPDVTARISARDVQARLAQLESLIPLSDVAFEVYSLATQDAEAEELADRIGRDATLTAEVLKLANSAYCGAGNRRIDTIEEAIVRIGRRSMGDLALLVSVRQSLADQSISWINRKLLWRRSLASAIALKQLSDSDSAHDGTGKQVDDSLYLCALLHPIGRLALATIFPDEHRALVERCEITGESLDVAEQKRFGLTHGQVGARLITAWKLPLEVRTLLEHISRPFNKLFELRGTIRQRVGRLKLAVLIGQIAAKGWAAWDTVDLPPERILKDAGISSLQQIVSAVEQQLVGAGDAIGTTADTGHEHCSDFGTSGIIYRSSVDESEDTLRILLKLAGVTLLDASSMEAEMTLINGVTSTGEQIAKLCRDLSTQSTRAVTFDTAVPLPDTVTRVALPASLHDILS